MICRVVLLRTEIAANVGATARVMANFGLGELVLVAPVADPRSLEARVLATHGETVLEQCRVVGELGEAVADCVFIVGASARTGGLFRRQSVGTPEEVLPHLLEASASGPTALVFGPESSGLSNEEVSRCHFLINVPTDPTCPALNLAQAVAICLYELRRSSLHRASSATTSAIATFAAQERMFALLRESLSAIEYLRGEKADALMHGLRHLLGRARPSPMEIGLLTGLARQIQWFAEKHKVREIPELEGPP